MADGKFDEGGNVIRWLLFKANAHGRGALEVFYDTFGGINMLLRWVGLVLCKEVGDSSNVGAGALR